jgi:hypothetical protein
VALIGSNGVKPDRDEIRRLYEEHGLGLLAYACSFLHGFTAYVDGAFDVRTPPGDYTLTVSKGFEYRQQQAAVTLMAGESVFREYRGTLDRHAGAGLVLIR